MGIFNTRKDDDRIKDDDYFRDDEHLHDHVKDVDEEKLLLRKEELDIAKDRIKTGDVEISKEIIEENKKVDVPVTHEEVIIERNAIDDEPTDDPIRDEDSIHIPVSREKVEVGKHTVINGEVNIKKREVNDIHHVDEKVKREEIRVDKDGDPNIVDSHLS